MHELPEPAKATPNLFLWYVMATGLDANNDALHSEFLRDQDDMKVCPVTRVPGRLQEIQLGRMGEYGLGDKRAAFQDCRLTEPGGFSRGIVGMTHRVFGPTLLGDEVGIDEG